MPIRKLSALLVNQIAAGEVIERPASLVRELVENALDAGAARIEVAVEEGGRERVRVADDGGGIGADQLPLALEAHATSKIAGAEDLAAVRTMGFRGEALASIASVARLRLTSRPPGAQAGAVIEAEGEDRRGPAPAACAPGTIVEVRNLFFNTPARRKFMRAASTEFGHVNDTLTRIAMAHPAVGFKLTHGNRAVFDLPPGRPPRRRCLDLLGGGLDEALLGFESAERGVGLWGLAGLPELARATAKHQYVYVNGRPVRDRNLMHAIREAYRGLIEPGRQPTLVLFVRLDPASVDVNVHPAKSEVRFADAGRVHGQVLAAIRQRLLRADLTPSVSPAPHAGPTRRPALEPSPPPPPPTGGNAAAGRSVGSIGDFVDYFRRMDPNQKGLAYERVKEAMSEDPDPLAPRRDGSADRDAADAGGDRLTEPIRPARSALQVHDSYIVTQDEAGIVIIDQHALHERMMFETLQGRIRRSGRLESQRLITPATLTASPGRIDRLERLTPLLETIGVEAGPMGPGVIAVQAFPTLLFDRGLDPAPFLDALLDRAEEDGFDPSDEAALHEVLDMISCKAAVKAGDRMKPGELDELLRRRAEIERSSNCPHGRPTTVRLTIRDLERHFKRS